MAIINDVCGQSFPHLSCQILHNLLILFFCQSQLATYICSRNTIATCQTRYSGHSYLPVTKNTSCDRGGEAILIILRVAKVVSYIQPSPLGKESYSTSH